MEETTKVIYRKAFPQLYAMFADFISKGANDGIKTYHDIIRPPPPEGMKYTSKLRYHYWDLLLDETAVMSQNPEMLAELENFLNNQMPRTEYSSFIMKMHEFPFFVYTLAFVNQRLA